ncbi:MAG: flavodoxin family protein [Planctomycetota bacterium]
MSITVLGVAASPRRDGNTDLLLQATLEAAAEAGAQTERVVVRDLDMRPCIECNGCQKTGRCVVRDDMTPVFDKLLACDALVFASPIFFAAVSAYAKRLIDRCQCFWVAKYVLDQPLHDPPRPGRRGLFLSCCGWRERWMFDCARRTFKALFNTLELDFAGELCYPGIDDKGDILDHPIAMAEARAAGAALARGDAIDSTPRR